MCGADVHPAYVRYAVWCGALTCAYARVCMALGGCDRLPCFGTPRLGALGWGVSTSVGWPVRRVSFTLMVMAVWSKRVVVGTSPVRVDDPETAPTLTVIMCNRSSVSLFLGGSTVSTATGFELMPGDMLTMRMPQAQGGVYAVAGTAGNRLDRMQVSS